MAGWVLVVLTVWSGGAEPVKLSVAGGKLGFTRIEPGASAILFTNLMSDYRSLTNRNYLSGSGVAAGDVDGDGLADLYFCGLESDNVLYKNLGNWKFEDITAKAGVACKGDDSTGATLADVEGDGDLDLLVNALAAGTRLFLNDGKGVFTESTDAAGLRSRSGATSHALGDIDGDGDLDLYVCNFSATLYRDFPDTKFRVEYVRGQPVITHVNDRPTTSPDLTNRFVLAPSGTVFELGELDVLWLNDGTGKFSAVPFTGGRFLDEAGQPLKAGPQDWGLAVQFYDFTGDGAPDIYVCNDLFTPDRIWINNGKGIFRAIEMVAIRNTSTFSMGVDFGDLDRDGDADFFVADMLSREHTKRQVQVGETSPIINHPGGLDHRPQNPNNTLLLNRGDGTFAEISRYAGVEAAEWSWCPIFLDVDFDGYEDILVSNGMLRDFQNADIAQKLEEIKAQKKLSVAEIQNLFQMFPGLYSHKILFHNQRDLTFKEVGKEWGFDLPGISQGMALADLDNDGDQDLVINNFKDVAGVYRNNAPGARVAVRLKGKGKNSYGIGAKIRLHGGPFVQEQEMISGGRYVSSDDPFRAFAALGAGPWKLEVIWRDGTRSVVDNVQSNHLYTIDQATAGPFTPPAKAVPTPLFVDVSESITHKHTDELFDDFQRQPLLPMRLGQLGPGITWHDYDEDGHDDLFVGGSRGGKLAVFKNLQGLFTPLTDPFLQRPLQRDLTTLIGIDQTIFAGSSNYKDGMTNGGWTRIYDLSRMAAGENVLGPESSSGPMSAADFNGDGQLDLFIGGRVKVGKYPEESASLLLTQQEKRFVPSQKLTNVWLVSGSTFADIDADGDSDLLLACHWSAVRVFVNEKGQFADRTAEWGLDKWHGFWNGIATGDFDNDGRLDLLVSNWGLNTAMGATADRPLNLYFGDFDKDSIIDLIESRYEPQLQKEVPMRNLHSLGPAFPAVREKVGTYEKYGQSSVQDLFSEQLKVARKRQVNELRSMLFLNRGGKFEARPLEREAQYAPGFGVCVADFNGDGFEDAFLSQNFFSTNLEQVRADAGRGLLLLGDGKGNLRPVPGQESGVQVYGEQRGAAVSDFDADGRVDLAVTQNAGATKLYQNSAGKPGLRVRLRGGPGNPMAVGTQVRVQSGGQFGPLRELQAGSGYWSQNSAVQVFAAPAAGAKISVRWPGGKNATYPIPAEAAEIVVTEQGVQKIR